MKTYAYILLVVNLIFNISIYVLEGHRLYLGSALTVIAIYSLWKNNELRNGVCAMVALLAVARTVYVIYEQYSAGMLGFTNLEIIIRVFGAVVWLLSWVLFLIYLYKTRNEPYKNDAEKG